MDNENVDREMQGLRPEDVEVLENELRIGLRHVPAPAGFEDRLMARVHARAAKKSRGLLATTARPSAWWQVAAAALVLAVGGDVMYLHHVKQQRETAAAQAEVDRALQLTSHALDQVQDGLDRSPAGRFTQVLFETGK